MRSMLNQTSEASKMSITEKYSITKSFSKIPAPSEKLLLAVIAAFLILHIAAGVILVDASKPAATATREEARASLYD
jgi:hypothetical protein